MGVMNGGRVVVHSILIHWVQSSCPSDATVILPWISFPHFSTLISTDAWNFLEPSFPLLHGWCLLLLLFLFCRLMHRFLSSSLSAPSFPLSTSLSFITHLRHHLSLFYSSSLSHLNRSTLSPISPFEASIDNHLCLVSIN